MTHAIDLVIYIIMTLVSLVMTVIGFLDALLAGLMSAVGIPPNVQFILLAVAAIMLVIAALRALGGLFAALIVVLLVLMLLHRLNPGLELHQGHAPAWLTPPPVHSSN